MFGLRNKEADNNRLTFVVEDEKTRCYEDINENIQDKFIINVEDIAVSLKRSRIY